MTGYSYLLFPAMAFLAMSVLSVEAQENSVQTRTTIQSSAENAPQKNAQTKENAEKRKKRQQYLHKILTLKDPIKSFGQNGYCINCHQDETPAIFEEWVRSPHAIAGVGCADCHVSPKGNPDSVEHFERFFISPIVTPFDCAKCHKDQLRGYTSSAHAHSLKSLQNMKEDDPRYPVIVQFKDDNFARCSGCHGSIVKLTPDNKPDPSTWPNKGAGRSNHDRSHGNCNSCHLGHRFSLQVVRQPDTCLRCHDGENYPEGDIYRHSAHSSLFETLARGELQNDRPGLYLKGKDIGAPTCAYCHMNGGGKGLLNRHDPAWRLPRDLCSPEATLTGNAKNLRKNMKSVCNQCHGGNFTNRFFTHADKQLQQYQKKTVEPMLQKYLEQLSKLTGNDRGKTLKEYSQFLAEGKRYRMNLYMGGHSREQR